MPWSKGGDGATLARMKRTHIPFLLSALILVAFSPRGMAADPGGHDWNGPHTGEHLARIAFPIGGMGAGMVCLEGCGALSHVSVRNRPEVFNEPCAFAAIHVKGLPNGSKLLEGPVPRWKAFGQPNSGNGSRGTTYGLPRFARASFLARFPFAAVTLADPDVPLAVEITGWSPFVPGDADSGSLPVGALEYQFRNTANKRIEAVFSWHAANFMRAEKGDGSIAATAGGFVLRAAAPQGATEKTPSFAFCAAGEDAVVDHSWFRGGWFDPLSLVWESIATGRLLENSPQPGSPEGASLYVPFALGPGETKTVRLLLAWHVPTTEMRFGARPAQALSGPAFGAKPAPGKAANQQPVTGFAGRGLVNTFFPGGDGLTGRLVSPEFTVTASHIHFLIGGGEFPTKTCVQLLLEGKPVRSATGRRDEALQWASWDVSEFRGKPARIEIVDESTAPWGHVNIDQIVMADRATPDEAWRNLTRAGAKDIAVLHDFEGDDYGGWTAPAACSGEPGCCPERTSTPPEPFHSPWYAGRFKDIGEVVRFWGASYDDLRARSARFRDCFYDTTLPDVVVEAIAANLTILKSPTVLRQKDGRLWCFEGCSDGQGCCPGSCTHVWNYAQAIPHLFPDLERTLRETEFGPSQDERGHQTFRSALPIGPTGHEYHAAADGQFGGIMKVYREWRISGDTDWLRRLWPKVRASLEFCIAAWDPRGKGALEEPHHNTYDIEYWGPDGHCGSFYLGALLAATKMGEALGEDVTRWRELLEKGRAFLESELFNGEYFIHKVQFDGLNATPQPIGVDASGPGYRGIIETINRQGPKYQYGTGCLSDGVLGFWIAHMCGLDGNIVDREKIRSHLEAVHRYNLKEDLSDHANPQRPSYAVGNEGGLLLCTWPRGGAPSLPFVYSNEVWTGIEYQAAAHLMLEGRVEAGLDIVRACRRRYDGRVRNPFNEYECGHWYARALSSYGMIPSLTGVRYDAIDQTLHIDSRIGDNFRSFLATATGYGTVGLKDGKPFIEMKSGHLKPKTILVSGKPLDTNR